MEVVLYTPESDITVYVCILVFYVFLPTVLLYGRHEDGDAEPKAEPAPLAKPSPAPEPEPAAAYEVSDLELTILTCLQDNEITARHIVRALKDSWPDITRKDVNRCLYRLYGEGIVRKGGISWSMSP
jgi:hypothetical protein